MPNKFVWDKLEGAGKFGMIFRQYGISWYDGNDSERLWR